MLGDRVTGLAAENIVQAGLGTAFIAQAQEVLQRIGNPPAGEEVDRDVKLVLGGHIRRIAVPLENPLVDRIDLLDEGHLDLQTGSGHRIADRLAELGDDHLLDFAHRIDRTHRDEYARCPEPPGSRFALFMAGPPSGIEIQQGQDAARLFIDNDLGAYAWHDVLQGLDIDAAARDLRGLAVFRQQGAEPGGIAFRFIDPLEPVAVGLTDALILLALGQRDHLVVIAPGFVDQFLFLLLGLVDLVERLLHRLGRVDVLQLHLVDADPHCVFGREFLHLGQRFRFDFLAADGNHLVHGAIADDFPHHGFGNIAQGFTRLPHLEQEFNGIRDAVLHHPFHQCGIQVTGYHLGFPLSVDGDSGRDRWHPGS